MTRKVVFHPDVLSVDIPALQADFLNRVVWDKLEVQINKALAMIANNPSAGARLKRPPLETWWKFKFHSTSNPKAGVNADMRLVYRFDEATVWVLAIRARKPGNSEDVYRVGNSRVLHERPSTPYRARDSVSE